jgi:hypothetical protein
MAIPGTHNCSAVNIPLSKIKKLAPGYAKMSSNFSNSPRSSKDIKRNSPNLGPIAIGRNTFSPKSYWRIGKAFLSEKLVRLTATTEKTQPGSQHKISTIK